MTPDERKSLRERAEKIARGSSPRLYQEGEWFHHENAVVPLARAFLDADDERADASRRESEALVKAEHATCFAKSPQEAALQQSEPSKTAAHPDSGGRDPRTP